MSVRCLEDALQREPSGKFSRGSGAQLVPRCGGAPELGPEGTLPRNTSRSGICSLIAYKHPQPCPYLLS